MKYILTAVSIIALIAIASGACLVMLAKKLMNHINENMNDEEE